jgi:hypothetical protein
VPQRPVLRPLQLAVGLSWRRASAWQAGAGPHRWCCVVVPYVLEVRSAAKAITALFCSLCLCALSQCDRMAGVLLPAADIAGLVLRLTGHVL